MHNCGPAFLHRASVPLPVAEEGRGGAMLRERQQQEELLLSVVLLEEEHAGVGAGDVQKYGLQRVDVVFAYF